MNYLETLVQLDGAAIAALDGGSTARDSERTLGDDERRAIAVIRAEIEAVAVLIAVSASVVSAIAEGGPGRRLAQSIDTYLPAELALVTHIAGPMLRSDAGITLLSDLRAFEVRLDLLRRMSRAFAADAREGTPGRSGVAIDILADGWRSFCETTVALLDATEAIGVGSSDKAGRLRALLLRAERGEHDLVDHEGIATVPGWAERRRHARHPVVIAATLVVGSAIHPVTVIDVSVGGLGLGQAPALARGCDVLVKLADGRRLTGRVAWSREDVAGIAFATPLDPADPLLTAGRR